MPHICGARRERVKGTTMLRRDLGEDLFRNTRKTKARASYLE